MKRLALGVAISLVVACSLTTDLDGFTNEVTDAGSKPTDGTSDGTTSPKLDGSSIIEAGSDTGAPTLCPDKPVALCEEFETDETKNGWSIVRAGDVTIGTATAPWGEHGLVVTTPKADTGDAPVAYWRKKFSKTITKLSLDIDLELDQYPTNNGEYHNTVGVRIDHGDTYHYVYLSISTGAVGYAVQDFPRHPNGFDYRVVPVLPGQRHHVHFEVEVNGASRCAVDGVVAIDVPTPSFFASGVPSVDVGVGVSQVPATAMTMGFAHLVFTGE